MDSGLNGIVSYHLVEGDTMNHFTVVEDNGHILVGGSLDREMIPSYRLIVEARDQGKPSLASRISIIIDIDDVNDNPPIFSQANYTAVVQVT